MADFLHQSQSYDEAKVREDLTTLKLELQDEMKLSNTLLGDPTTQLAAAKDFVDMHETAVADLKAELDIVSEELRATVLANKVKQAALEELNTLAKSDRYQALADDISALKAELAADHDFLVAQGVEGRRF